MTVHPRVEKTLRRSADWLAGRISHLEERLAEGDEIVWLQHLDAIKTLAVVLPALTALDRSRRRR